MGGGRDDERGLVRGETFRNEFRDDTAQRRIVLVKPHRVKMATIAGV
jgi:hypothetical protein